MVELLLLNARSPRFLNYCLTAYVQVAGGEYGRIGSLNTQFGTWMRDIAHLAAVGKDGGLEKELTRLELLWTTYKDDPNYVPVAKFCTAPYDLGKVCDWYGDECTYWHRT